MASYVPYLPFVALSVVAFVQCGGRISVLSTVDAGATDSGSRPPDSTLPFTCPDPAAVGSRVACDTTEQCPGAVASCAPFEMS
jgi:hypothetical protein